MELSPSIIEWCKYEALGQCLTQWSTMDDTPCGYEEVLELLRDEDLTDVDRYDKHGIMVWNKYEDEDPEWLADHIESLYESYINCAEFALGWDIPNEEGFTPRQLRSIAEQIAEDN